MTGPPEESAGEPGGTAGEPGAAGEPEAKRAEQRVLGALRELGLAHRLIRIDPANAATADFCRAYGWPPEASANCLLVAGRADPPRHAACLVAATRQVDVNRTVRRLLGVRKASFAPPEEVVALTGMTPHGVTPFGLPEDVAMLIDAALTELDEVVVGGGSRRLKIAVAPGALAAVPGANVVEGLSRPLPAGNSDDGR